MVNFHMKSISAILALLVLFSDTTLSQAPFDHNDQHCHDVSIYKPVEYTDRPCQKCTTEFEQYCEPRREEICQDVPATKCQLVGWVECKFVEGQATYIETEMIPDGQYREWVCRNETREETHIKLVPKCVPVIRQDCVTKWEVNQFGEKVWAGNEDCRPVEWQNCTLVETPKLHNNTYTICEQSGQVIPTLECRETNKTKTVMNQDCIVQWATNCTCVSEQVCVTVEWDQCSERAKPTSCTTTSVRVPYQEKVHRVKCLLPDRSSSPDLNVEDSAREAERKLNENRRTGREGKSEVEAVEIVEAKSVEDVARIEEIIGALDAQLQFNN